LLTAPPTVIYVVCNTLPNPDVCSNQTTITITLDTPPIAIDNLNLTYTGTTATPIDVLANDTTGDTVVATTVSLVVPAGATGGTPDANGDILSVVVPNEGTWTVDPVTGTITFTPLATFTGIPTPIKYNVEDAQGTQSNDATVSFNVPPIAIDNLNLTYTGTTATPIDVLANDTTGDTCKGC
jgi:large repetitive protein